MISDIFVPMLTYPEPTSNSAFSDLAKFSKPFATSITACAFEVEIPDVRPRLGGQMVDISGMAAQIEAGSRTLAQSLIDAAASSSPGVIAKRKRVLLANLAQVATRMARSHDLTMFALDPSSDEKKALAQALAFETGRPVILAPEGVESTLGLGTIAIAWDGGRSASRAVHDAMPLIVEAEKTVVLTAFDDKDIGQAAVADLVEYLERQGVAVSHADVSSPGKVLGSTLQMAAHEQGAGLLVMGAFGHSRLRDFVLGGATRNILHDLKMPVFLSH
jgi:nucleotide-binding universal stress UspA family protein